MRTCALNQSSTKTFTLSCGNGGGGVNLTLTSALFIKSKLRSYAYEGEHKNQILPKYNTQKMKILN